MSNKIYDGLKLTAILIMPILNTFLVGFNEIWNIPYMGKIIATIGLLNTALGTFLIRASKLYNSCNDDLEYIDMEADDGK